MATRERRIADLKSMQELKAGSTRFDFEVSEGGIEPTKYLISFRCNSYFIDRVQRRPVLTGPDYCHKVEIFLDNDYPINPPRITWETEIFHPNIYKGYACILGGPWDATRSLGDVCRQLFEMAQFKNLDPRHVLEGNDVAAEWARNQPAGAFPADPTPLIDRGGATDANV